MPPLPPLNEITLNLGVLIGLSMAAYGLAMLLLAGVRYGVALVQPEEDRTELNAALERMHEGIKARNEKLAERRKGQPVDDEVPF